METLEELKAIVENAPEGATHYDGRYYIEHYCDGALSTYISEQGFWHHHTSPIRVTRSLSDIKAIIELMERVSKLEFVIDIANRNHVTKFNIELDKENSDRLNSYLNEDGNP